RVTDASRALDLVDGIKARDLLNRWLGEEVLHLVLIRVGSVEHIVTHRDVEPERGQVVTGIAPGQKVVVVAIVKIGEDDFAAVRRDARAAQDVAVAIADGDDLAAIRTFDHFAYAAARQVFIINLVLTRVIE